MEWKDSLQLCDFSPNEEESNFYHSYSMKNKPYLSLSILLCFFENKNYQILRNDQGLFIRFSHLHQLASRVPLLAMASRCFFPSGFVPRHQWGV